MSTFVNVLLAVLRAFSGNRSDNTSTRMQFQPIPINNRRIEIQAQNGAGANWQTYTITDEQSQLIYNAMCSLKSRFPESRVRAVDGNTGQMIDYLG
jgi:hypothetical protein